jgi:hypothetical protein
VGVLSPHRHVREDRVKDQLIAIIVDKTGVDQGKAEQAVDGIMTFLKDNPEKTTELLGEHAPPGVSKTIGKLFGR